MIIMVEFINVLICIIAIILTIILIIGTKKNDDNYFKVGVVIGLIGLYLIYISSPWIQI